MGRIADLLLTKGANPNIFDAASHQTPLHRAIVADNKPAFNALMSHKDHVDLDARDADNRVPLSLALGAVRAGGGGGGVTEDEIAEDSFAAVLADNGASAQIIQVWALKLMLGWWNFTNPRSSLGEGLVYEGSKKVIDVRYILTIRF